MAEKYPELDEFEKMTKRQKLRAAKEGHSLRRDGAVIPVGAMALAIAFDIRINDKLRGQYGRDPVYATDGNPE